MLYVRGNRRDYDNWDKLGNSGWSYDNVLPYFIKSEDNRNPKMARSRYHGRGGLLTVFSPKKKRNIRHWSELLQFAFITGRRSSIQDTSSDSFHQCRHWIGLWKYWCECRDPNRFYVSPRNNKKRWAMDFQWTFNSDDQEELFVHLWSKFEVRTSSLVRLNLWLYFQPTRSQVFNCQSVS